MIVIYFDKIHGLIRINESTTLFPDQPSILQHKPSINFSDQLLKEKKKRNKTIVYYYSPSVGICKKNA